MPGKKIFQCQMLESLVTFIQWTTWGNFSEWSSVLVCINHNLILLNSPELYIHAELFTLINPRFICIIYELTNPRNPQPPSVVTCARRRWGSRAAWDGDRRSKNSSRGPIVQCESMRVGLACEYNDVYPGPRNPQPPSVATCARRRWGSRAAWDGDRRSKNSSRGAAADQSYSSSVIPAAEQLRTNCTVVGRLPRYPPTLLHARQQRARSFNIAKWIMMLDARFHGCMHEIKRETINSWNAAKKEGNRFRKERQKFGNKNTNRWGVDTPIIELQSFQLKNWISPNPLYNHCEFGVSFLFFQR